MTKFTDEQAQDQQAQDQQAQDQQEQPTKPKKELSEVGAKISAAQSGRPKPTIGIMCNGVEYSNLTAALHANNLVDKELYNSDIEHRKNGDKLWAKIRNALKRNGEYIYQESEESPQYVFSVINDDWVAPQPTEEELQAKEQAKAERKAAKEAAKEAAKQAAQVA